MNAPLTQTSSSVSAQTRTTTRLGPVWEAIDLTDRMVDIGELSHSDRNQALGYEKSTDRWIGDILLANNFTTEEGLFRGLSILYECDTIDLELQPPDPALLATMNAHVCVAKGFVPWRRVGGRIVIATSRPHRFSQLLRELPFEYQDAIMALVPPSQIERVVPTKGARKLIHRAETRVKRDESCRPWTKSKGTSAALLIVALFAVGAWININAVALILFATALLALLVNTALKFAAACAIFFGPKSSEKVLSKATTNVDIPLKKVSVLVPLFKETAVTSRLIRRLCQLRYPRELLEIVLVVEDDDHNTQKCVAACDLPGFIRTVEVPHGSLRTKPRALNFALDFCDGEIVGVLDAEDAPEPNQIHKVVQKFTTAPADVACLQGILDFYNARSNWLSRCFTIEYASWFRVILPGISRLGLAVPLGGTTLYFRKHVLEQVGGWDAHNVTEDADLGIRLARYGYRTELFQTVTEEEANCRWLPWVRQRSRWLKGYAITWLVHMRAPAQLYRDLGPKKFWGFQAVFLGALIHFLLAPFLWTLWVLPFGIYHPLSETLSGQMLWVGLGLFLGAEVVNLFVSMLATKSKIHRGLWPWIPTLHLYFPLGTLAGYKAILELFFAPFYWDKTEHGHSQKRTPIWQVRRSRKAPLSLSISDARHPI